jgi:hypothetical protein
MEILEAYVLNIARREARKAFGSEPSIARHKLWKEHTNYEVSWDQVVYHAYGSFEHIAIHSVVKFDFPWVFIRISKCIHDQGRDSRGFRFFYQPEAPDYLNFPEELKEPWHHDKFHIPDPKSKKQLVQFFSETYRAVKKEALDKRRMRELIFRRSKRDEVF